MKRILFLLLALTSLHARADIVLRDDTQTGVRLPAPAQRIVSLAPNITELVYAAGAGAKLVGTVDFSDYPAAAKRLPRVGSYARVDIEARLAGTDATGQAAARDFRRRLAALQAQYAARRPVKVFYEVWDEPLMTVNGRQIISDVIKLCGGINVFADLPALAPTVSVEAVLAANPEAIVAGGMGEKNAGWLAPWRKWNRLDATKRGNLFFVDPNLLQRHTPRLLDGATQLCEKLEQARGKPR